MKEQTSAAWGEDPLADCLVILAAQNGRTISQKAIVAGLPLVKGALTPSLFVRAAERLNFSAKIVNRPLAEISALTLPVVLLLKDKGACILSERPTPDTAVIQLAESGGGVKRIPLKALEEQYEGHAIFIQPVPDLEDRLGAVYIGQKTSGTWFWRVLFRYRRLYLEVGLASIFINLFALASPLFIRSVYDRVLPNQAEYTLWVLAAGVIIIFIFDFILRMSRAYFINLAGKRSDVVLASRIFSHILNLELSHRPPSAGEFANRIREFETVRDFFSSATVAVLLDMPFVFLFLAVIWYLCGMVALVPLTAVPLILIVGLTVQNPLNKLVNSYLSESGHRHSVLVESISQLESIKSLGLQGWGQRRWEEAVGTTARSALATRLLASVGSFSTVWTQQMVTVMVIVVGFYQIVNGNLTMGGLIAATILSSRAIAPLGQVANLLTRLQRSRAALKSLDEVMRLPAERDFDRNYLSRPVLEGALNFRNVSFTYPGQKLAALTDVSFSIEAGEHVGLLGRVGSGKTTVHKLILGLYQPSEGSILVDGVDLAQIDPVDLRANISYIPQSATLFQGTVRSNLLALGEHIDPANLNRAAQISGLKGLIARHPLGLDMPVGETGGLLSGGQRQLVVMARALLRDCPVVLFDEPTTSLDNSAEQAFIAKVSPFLNGKTVILVTHKIPLLTLVDRLIILEEGRIVADGPKEAVLEALNKRKIKVKAKK
ncbi:MAG: type I secretion system permease/ATPase [Desulfarculaceae bacterium]